MKSPEESPEHIQLPKVWEKPSEADYFALACEIRKKYGNTLINVKDLVLFVQTITNKGNKGRFHTIRGLRNRNLIFKVSTETYVAVSTQPRNRLTKLKLEFLKEIAGAKSFIWSHRKASNVSFQQKIQAKLQSEIRRLEIDLMRMKEEFRVRNEAIKFIDISFQNIPEESEVEIAQKLLLSILKRL